MPTREVESAHQPVVVAARSMPLGTSLTEKDVKVIGMPAANPLRGAISSVKDVIDRGLIAPVVENELITASKLAPANTGAGLSPAIPQGMRAISVKVNDVIGVAGFVAPGSRVDLVATIRRQTDSMTITVASNVQVLTAGTRKDQEKELDGKSNETSVVTLVVTPEDGERIALAQSEGQIMLVLRNPLDRAYRNHGRAD
jgi:pilus assembly protein CpaB